MGIISFLEKNLLSCPWKQHLDIECMGCGMQRALIHVLKGEFSQAFALYPAVYTLLFLFIFLAFHLKFKYKNGRKIINYLIVINVLIISISYVYKMVY